MSKYLFAIAIFFLLSENCLAQDTSKKVFGIKNIDHESIAIDFMNNIGKENYSYCYDLVSQAYKADLNFQDFEFKMRMLNDLAEKDKFYHYKTTFIGKTAKEGLAIMRGELVTENIMPEYDFTIQSESDQEFKTVQIFIRFENENSDKISVINYGKHVLLDKKIGMSSVSSNPFIVGNYILVAEREDRIYVDIRGGTLRNELIALGSGPKNSVLVEIELRNLENLIKQNDTSNYSLIHVREKSESSLETEIRRIAGENGFSIFNHRNQELKSKSVNDIDTFLKKYKEGNWNPIEE